MTKCILMTKGTIDLFTTDILACHSRKSTDLIHNIHYMMAILHLGVPVPVGVLAHCITGDGEHSKWG